MLAIVSDLHLTDGTTSTTVPPDAFNLLRHEIQDAARQNGAKELRLLLLGDIFDVVRSDWWFRNTDWAHRPWNGKLHLQTAMNSDSAEVERQFGEVLESIFRHPSTKAFVRIVRGLARSKVMPKLKVTYVLGNHDRALNNFASLRRSIRTTLGVPVDFANAFTDPAYGVAARHGHEWDENCNALLLLREVLQKNKRWDPLDPAINQVMNLGEVITAELMSGLVWRVRQVNDPALTAVISQVDLLRPTTTVFQWIEWQTRSRQLSETQKTALAQALVEAISGVVDSAFGKLWDKVKTDFLVSGDLVDRLELVRSRLKASGYDGLRECVKFLVTVNNVVSVVASDKAEDYEGAKKEFDRLGPEFQYLVYGHTHFARHDYLSGMPDGRVRMYRNTGTYLPLVQATNDGRGFARSHQMTLTFFYREDEDTNNRADRGPTLDLWTALKRKEYT